MRKLLMGLLGLFAMLGFAQTASPLDLITAGATDMTISPRQAGRGALLFDSGSGTDVPAFAVVSQHFTDSILTMPFFTFGADDFTVTGCGWEINTVTAYGNYSLGNGPASSVNVYFVRKTGPTLTNTDLSMADHVLENLTYVELDPVFGGDFSIAIPPTVLNKGEWWIVVQVNMDVLVGGQWNWTESASAPNSGMPIGDESNWFQTANPQVSVVSPITGTATCVDTWGRRLTDCSMTRFPDSSPPSDPDFAFALEGTALVNSVFAAPTTLMTVEDGPAVTYDIYLTAPPCPGETVTITPISGDITEGNVSGPVVFTETNYDTVQTVTITPGPSGDGNDGDVMYTITNMVVSDDPSGCYALVTAADISVTNQNIEGTATITVNPTNGLTVDEDGTMTAMFVVATVGTPTDTVTVDLTPSAEVTLDVSSAVMNMANSFSATVTVTGVADDIVDGDQFFTVTTATSFSNDLAYSSIDPADVSGTVLDDDIANVVVTAIPNPLATSEAGGMSTIDYVLTAMPSADVVINLSIDDLSEVSIDQSILTFTNANWDTPQTVVATGVDDNVQDGSRPFTIIGGGTSSGDATWHGLPVTSISGFNADDADTAGFTVDDLGGVTTDESGTTDTFTVVLNSEPIFDVSVDFRSDNIGEGLVGVTPSGPFQETVTLTFTAANWSTPQVVTVEGQDDLVRRADGTVAYTIFSENIVSFDPIYDAITDAAVADISALNTDNDGAASLAVDPVSLTLQENGPSMTFTVNLVTQPTASSVMVPISSSDLTEATVAPNSLTFTDSNYATPQIVTVTPVEDDIIDADQTFDISLGPATGGNYTGLSAAVSVTVENIDTCGEMTLAAEIGGPILAGGTPTCVFDLYKTNNSANPADWILLGTFTVGQDGFVQTGVLAESDCTYITTITGTLTILTRFALITVPTLGEWGLIIMILALASVAILISKRQNLTPSNQFRITQL